MESVCVADAVARAVVAAAHARSHARPGLHTPRREERGGARARQARERLSRAGRRTHAGAWVSLTRGTGANATTSTSARTRAHRRTHRRTHARTRALTQACAQTPACARARTHTHARARAHAHAPTGSPGAAPATANTWNYTSACSLYSARSRYGTREATEMLTVELHASRAPEAAPAQHRRVRPCTLFNHLIG